MKWTMGLAAGLAFTTVQLGCSSDGPNPSPGAGGAGLPGTGGTTGNGGSDSGASGGSEPGASGGSDSGANGGSDPGASGGSDSGSNGGSDPGASGGNDGSGGAADGAGGQPAEDCTDTGAAENFSFFVTSWHHIRLLSGSEDGFGGDLRYNGAATGLEGADSLCQEMARRVCHGDKTWKAYLSTSSVNAKDRIGSGPWHDWSGKLVANDISGLLGTNRPAGGCCDRGVYDELGTFHDGTTDVNNDGIRDDDHDTMTATNVEGTYNGFSCDDWTSTTAMPPNSGGGGGFGGLRTGIMMGHTWPAQSGQSWVTSHAGHACAAGTNFIQNGPGDSATVGGGGGYGGFYCFALAQ